MTAISQVGPRVGVTLACKALGVCKSSYYRFRKPAGDVVRKPLAKPHFRAITAAEETKILGYLNSDRFMDSSPREVYARLLDEGIYLCSVSSMYRILKKHKLVRERRKQSRHKVYSRPELLATGPNQVWSWDITRLLGPVKWTYYYLYVIIDIYSRYVAGWMIAHRESSELAKRLIKETCRKQGIVEGQLTIHADRGSSMKSKPVALMLADLGVTKTHSRPYVSNDNPFSESQFKTLKYCSRFPGRFGCIEDARCFCQEFFPWYNWEHYHSGIGLLTPGSLHYGQADEVITKRSQVLEDAYLRNPHRFVRAIPTPPGKPTAVWINPPQDDKILLKENKLDRNRETITQITNERRLISAH